MSESYANIPVVLLCGGEGIRLGEQGSVIPKAMVEINGLPLLLYIMDHYGRTGFRKFFILTGYRGAMIRDFVRSIPHIGSRLELRQQEKNVKEWVAPITVDAEMRHLWEITVIDTGSVCMTGSRLAQMRPYLGSEDVFSVTYGDTVSDVNLTELFSFHKDGGKIATLLAVHNPTRFRILGLFADDNRVRGFSEKPVMEKDYINGGFYVFNKDIFELPELNTNPDCVLETTILECLVSKKELQAYRHDGFWQPVDNERDVKRLSMSLNHIW